MASQAKRAIDDLPEVSPRSQQMQVLCLGLSRTGTMSLQSGFDKLGYRTYHFKEVGQRDLPNESHVDCWREAFLAKMYGNGKPYGKAEFDKLLRNYSAVTDAPCVCFADDLVEAYPNAKVILSNRDPQKWLASMETAFYRVLTSREFRFFRAVSALDYDFLWPYLDLLKMPLRMWTNDDCENREKLLQAFDAHYKHVREIVPEQNLLEWTVSDGWEPICKFLGKPVPDEPFPYINKGMAASDLHLMLGRIRAAQMLWGMVKWPTVLCLGAFAAWKYVQ